MDLEGKLNLILDGVEEVVTKEELLNLLNTGGGSGYLGFEPSGIFHIGWLVWAYKFRDLVNAGIKMYLLAATWHAWINDKLGGNKELIRKAVEHVKVVLDSLGIEGKYNLVYAEDLAREISYWDKLLRAAKSVSLARVKRALTIMGRKEDEGETDFSKLIYPLMQVTDINYLNVDIALGGMDQRKAHMLQRDISEKLGWKKVIAIHTPLLPSLQMKGRMDSSTLKKDMSLSEFKMSKSRPESAVLIIDSDAEIRTKIRKAYCPARVIEDNPVIAIAKNILFRAPIKEFVIERPEKYGGRLVFDNYLELERLYVNGEVHPLDLKNAVAEHLIDIIRPIRERILRDPELLDTVGTILKSITR